MSSLIGIYFGTVTANGTDGTRVSEGTESTPFEISGLDTAANDVSANYALAIRCNDSFYASNDATITPTGTTASMWCLANYAGTWSNYGEALTFTSQIPDTNVLFWAKAKTVSTENPVKDTSVDLVISATINAE